MKIVGTKGKDVLTGTSGTDYINGKGGSDVIVSNGGDDVLSGGRGKDTFVFLASPEDGDDLPLILDFNPKLDTVVIITNGFTHNVSPGYDEDSGFLSVFSVGPDVHVADIGSGLYLYPESIVIA